MSEEEALRECPHCGSIRITVWNIRDGQQAVCKDCKSTGSPTFHGPEGFEATRGKAIAAWNNRRSSPAQAAMPVAHSSQEVDEIVSQLYRRFKDWSKRGFGPDDVTWCEVKADILALIAAPSDAMPVAWVSENTMAMLKQNRAVNHIDLVPTKQHGYSIPLFAHPAPSVPPPLPGEVGETTWQQRCLWEEERADKAEAKVTAQAAELERVKAERDEAVNWSAVVDRHGTDQFDDLAEAWLGLEAIKRVTNAVTSTFSKWANDELMERFRKHQLDMFHMAFVEGCLAGVKAAEAKSEAVELAAAKAEVERYREAILAYENSPDPVADCWDTEDGEAADGAAAFPSDWAHHAADYERAVRRDKMREAVGLPALVKADDFRRNIGPIEPARSLLEPSEPKPAAL